MKEKLNKLPIDSPKEVELTQRFEILRLEPTDIYTFPEIANKLANGVELNEIESQMASACIRDWIRLKESITGRPKKWHSMSEKNYHHNNKKRKKVCYCSFCQKEK
jgi:hypothetical protein